MTETLAHIAKGYVHNDKLSVIPVGKDKRPLISWKEFQTRRATDDEIDDWFRKNPDAQLGIVTGKISNLSVVDIEFGGDPSFLPQETLVIKTGGNGWHYYYRYCEGLMNKARIRELVDIRSEGGYVVAPPSSTEKGSYEVIKKHRPIEFPKELFIDQIVVVPESAHGGVQNEQNGPENDFYPGYGPGQRNDQMTRFIGQILRKTHPAEWETKAWHIVQAANQKNTPPLDQNELRASWHSIRGREMKNPDPRPWQVPQKEEPKVVFPDDGSDMVMPIAEVAEKNKINIDDIFPMGMPYFDQPLMGGALPGDLIIIAGPTGNGKTVFAQDMSLGLMRGRPDAKVLFFSYEVLPQFVWKKYQDMGALPTDPLYIPLKHSSGSVDWIEKKILEAKEKFQVNVVVIDHIGFLEPKSGGPNMKQLSSNYSTYLTMVARNLKQLAISQEIIIITPAHVRKTEDLSLNDIANSAGIGQESDAVFLIERERNKTQSADSYYTEFSKISLAKNRRTGQSVTAWFTLFNGRFMWDQERNKQEETWRNINADKVEPTPVPAVEVEEELSEAIQEEIWTQKK